MARRILRNRTSKRTIVKEQRAHEILRLRRDGDEFGNRLTHKEIAKRVCCSPGLVYTTIKESLADLRAETQDYADIIRQKDVDTCDHIINIMMTKVREETDIAAANTALKAIERKSKLLGTETPARIEHTGAGGGAIAVNNLHTLDERELYRMLQQQAQILEAAFTEEQEDDSDTDEGAVALLPEHSGMQSSAELLEEQLQREPELVQAADEDGAGRNKR